MWRRACIHVSPLLVGAALAGAPLAGCTVGERSPTDDAPSGTSGAGGAGGAGGEGGGGSSPGGCEACWQGACDEEGDACFDDDSCRCKIDCEEDLDCLAACPESAAFTALLACFVEATVGPCAGLCEAGCEACLTSSCAGDFAACLDEAPCVCQLWCDDEVGCDEACGASTAREALDACVTTLPAGTCSGTCS